MEDVVVELGSNYYVIKMAGVCGKESGVWD